MDYNTDDNYTLEKEKTCIDCKNCMEVCDTYIVIKNELKSPNGRLKIAYKIYISEKISQEELQSIYTCTLCGLYNLFCLQS